jgi:hypothetical protein
VPVTATSVPTPTVPPVTPTAIFKPAPAQIPHR